MPKVVLSAACAIATGAPQLVYGGYGSQTMCIVHRFFVFVIIVVIVKIIVDVVMDSPARLWRLR